MLDSTLSEIKDIVSGLITLKEGFPSLGYSCRFAWLLPEIVIVRNIYGDIVQPVLALRLNIST